MTPNETFLMLRAGLSRLDHEVTTFLQRQGTEPEAGSQAASERTNYSRSDSLYTVAAIGTMLLESAGEHVTVLARAMTEPITPFACLTCVRSMLESASIAAWLFDPKVDAQKRVGRAFAHRYEGLEEQVKFGRAANIPPDELKKAEDRVDKVDQDAVALGHEGVVVKSLTTPYAAGRRGAGWIKVKPRHTLDLVVLAVEWGHGRRNGWLSNLHLGARDPETGGWVMLGKTFKGLTDEMLTWQTERLLALEDRRDDWTVYVRPELVVEIAFDGVQRSPRYPGGVALRFARVLRYREDKPATEADTIDTVTALAPPAD